MQQRVPILCVPIALLSLASTGRAAPPGDADGDRAADAPAADESEQGDDSDEADPELERREAHDLAGRQLPDPAQTPPIRRGGLTFGMGAGAALGGASGYPNDGTKIDHPEFYANTGAGFGVAASLWLGYAIADWVSFGLAVNAGWVDVGDSSVRSGGAGVRVELFPAWPLGGHWREIGLWLEPGLGFTMVEANDGRLDPLIESGTGSHVSLGLFYEGVRFWQFAMGPYLGLDAIWSSSSLNPTGVLGWRAVYYAGP